MGEGLSHARSVFRSPRHVFTRELPGGVGATGAQLLALLVGGPPAWPLLCKRGESLSSSHVPAGPVKEARPLYEAQAGRCYTNDEAWRPHLLVTLGSEPVLRRSEQFGVHGE